MRQSIHVIRSADETMIAWSEAGSAFTGRPTEQANDILVQLSPREREILEKIAEGCTNIEIGRRLFISDKTVRNHVTHIFEKLDVSSRAQAIVLAKDRGLV